MTSAFIVRPFSVKKEIDFDRVEALLIGPALDAHGIADRTTLDILHSGNIRTDMFRKLLTSDLVIADVSVHNANVFYELGIRHALRPRHTVLIRCKGDDFPFDLFTDRYMSYDQNDPAAAVALLTKTIGQTLRHKEAPDSPIFLLIPNLPEPDADSFIAVPAEFTASVDRARRGLEEDDTATKLGDLALLGEDIKGLPWETGGLRLIGNAEFHLQAGAAATETWERVRARHPEDAEANQFLATTYQRQRDFAASDEAIRRVLDKQDLAPRNRSEALALQARNAKSEWLMAWTNELPERRAAAAATAAPRLVHSHEQYFAGFLADLSYYYPGVNALAMAILGKDLAKRFPDEWRAAFPNDREAKQQLELIEPRIDVLLPAVELAIDATPRKNGQRDRWAEVSRADLAFYRGASPQRVIAQYKNVVDKTVPFHLGAVRDQLTLFSQLGVRSEAAEAALAALPVPDSVATPEIPHIVVFTGHRIDVQGAKPRFPASAEADVTEGIGRALDQLLARRGTNLLGIAGGANGGDILFHEACIDRGIPSIVYLALPPEDFAAASVSDGGPRWTDRFYHLLEQRRSRVLQKSKDLPPWLAEKREPYSIWERSNVWMLTRGLVHGGAQMTLLALWNGQKSDRPGGTWHMVIEARKRGATVVEVEGLPEIDK